MHAQKRSAETLAGCRDDILSGSLLFALEILYQLPKLVITCLHIPIIYLGNPLYNSILNDFVTSPKERAKADSRDPDLMSFHTTSKLGGYCPLQKKKH